MIREEYYSDFLKQLKSLLKDERDWLANLANTASLIYNLVPKLNWVGFYLMDSEEEMVLGPFQGQPACVRIKVGNGVCGTAVAKRKTQLVENVHDFDGHIACDPASKSELVIPLEIEGTIIGVLDIDSPAEARFNREDQDYLEKAVKILIEETDFTPLLERERR
ncbi:GAF domain-containing protein [Halanaerobiaceae bacterium Z-7014]|uniref:GAF domain-containing protein n=1 Tax=Halonatronomonas betaini TaxID=2778430 RepID=A0A931AR57_9FIRM|nr:GAF domain-containing protein [Halonatronomonas betaini]MBF8437478.1 GAF domain-containing protein [Halonatronomonas betaini]